MRLSPHRTPFFFTQASYGLGLRCAHAFFASNFRPVSTFGHVCRHWRTQNSAPVGKLRPEASQWQ